MMTFSQTQPDVLSRFLSRVSAGRLVILVAVAFLFAGPPEAWSADRILIVGNSFTRGIKSNLGNLTKHAMRDAKISVRGRAGATLNDHAVSRSTLRKLRTPGWDFVVLQDQSDGIGEERYPGARALDEEITAIGAETIFFMTWADRDDGMEAYDKLRGVPFGSEGYVPIAMELDAAVAPIGWAFRELLLEEPGADLWRTDGHHAGDRGRYLAALVLYSVIYRESPVGLWATHKLTPEQVLHDQLLVERVVFQNSSEWNLDVPAP